MLDELVHTTLPDGWESVDDGPGSLVGVHDDAELYVWESAGNWLVSAVQTVESDGYRVDVTTHSADFPDQQQLTAYLTGVLEAIETGRDVIEAIALVGHDGTTEEIEITEDEPLVDQEEIPDVADVFAVYPDRLPDKTSADDIAANRNELISVLYGETMPSESEAFQMLSNEREAYDSIALEVFSVSEYSLEPIDSSET